MSDLNIRVSKKRLLRVTANSSLFFLGIFGLYVIDNAICWNGWLVGTPIGLSIWILTIIVHMKSSVAIADHVTMSVEAAENFVSLTGVASLVGSCVLTRDADGSILAIWVGYVLLIHVVSFVLVTVIPAFVIWVNRLIDKWEP